jgi:hypothetical protein
MDYPPPICYFCGEKPTSEYVILVGQAADTTPPETWTMFWLCQVHHGILVAAGERGRRYAYTETRLCRHMLTDELLSHIEGAQLGHGSACLAAVVAARPASRAGARRPFRHTG